MSLSNVSSYSSPSYQNQQNPAKKNNGKAENQEKDATQVDHNHSNFSSQDMIMSAYDDFDMSSGSKMEKPEDKPTEAPKREPIRIELPENVSLPIKVLFICFISPWLFFASILMRIYNLMNNPFPKHREAKVKKNALFYAIEGKKKIDSRIAQIKPIFKDKTLSPGFLLKSAYYGIRGYIFTSNKSIPHLLAKGFKQGLVVFSNALVYADYQIQKDFHFVLRSIYYTGKGFGVAIRSITFYGRSISLRNRKKALSQIKVK